MIRSHNSLSLPENICDVTEGLFPCNTKIEESNILDETRNVLEEILKEVNELLPGLDKDIKLELKENRLMQDVKGTLDNILMAVEKLVGFGKLIIAFGDLEIESESSLAEDSKNSLSNILMKGDELASFGESLIAFGDLEIKDDENTKVAKEILSNILMKVEELVAIDELLGDEMVVTINHLNTQSIQSSFKNELEYFCFREDKPTESRLLETCSTKFVNSDFEVNEKVYEDDQCRSEKHLGNETKRSLNGSGTENMSIEKLAGNITEDAISRYTYFKEDNFKDRFDWSQWAKTFDSDEDDLLPIPSFRVIKRRGKKSMEVLKKETVHIKNRELVEKKLSELIAGGSSKLQVISDFDQTLSRVHKDGVKCATTYWVLEQAPFLAEDYRQQSACLTNYYHPIEVNPNLSRAEKTRHMIEWYTKSLNLMPSSGISKGDVPELVKASNACLRDGCDTLFDSLNKNNVPLLIFSAGVGDILKEILKQQNLMLPNMEFVANFMHFDEKNRLIGFKGNLIHTFNKNQTSIAKSDYFDSLKSRMNVILLGDSLGDIDMSEGAENVNVILKIGFLNYKIEDSLPNYLDAYDIVLTDDQTMDVVNGLLQNIL